MCPFCWIRACNHSLVVVLNWSHKHLWAIPTHSPLADRLGSSRFDVLLVWTWALGPPYRSINGIQVRALHRPVLGLCFVGRMRWCMNQFPFYCWQLEVFRIFINPSFFIIISTVTKFPRSRSTEAFPQQDTAETVLWVVSHSLLFPNISSVSLGTIPACMIFSIRQSCL